jgi:hypothetical protein
MEYLVKTKGPDGKQLGRCHIWDGGDTLCRMWSTGGIGTRGCWVVTDEKPVRGICSNCKSVERHAVDSEFQEIARML